MNGAVFLPGFDGDAALRADFMLALAERRPVVGVSYPNRLLGSLDGYREHAMGVVPVDWRPVLIAESFSGLVAARWAGIDERVEALVLCGSFARNPVGYAATLGASWPSIVKLGPLVTAPIAHSSSDERRRRWSQGLTEALAALRNDVVAERLRIIATEDVSQVLASLRIPVVVVHFGDDLVIGRPARDHLEAVCHNAHVLRLPGPHFAIELRPQECAQAIEEKLASLLPSRA
jgi:pimeloyl-ACP methyl ester carboxylesterase